MSQLYSKETVDAALAIQGMNISFVWLILGIALFLFVLRGFLNDVAMRRRLPTASSNKGQKRISKLRRLRVVIRRLYRSLRVSFALQCQLIRERRNARSALRDADDSDIRCNNDLLPAFTAGDFTPLSPTGKPWEHYEEPAFLRNGVQLSF